MNNIELIGDNCLVECLYIEEKVDIESLPGFVVSGTENADKRVDRWAAILGTGPDVKNLMLGEIILIPEKEDGRILFPLDGREFAMFPESAVRIKKII